MTMTISQIEALAREMENVRAAYIADKRGLGLQGYDYVDAMKAAITAVQTRLTQPPTPDQLQQLGKALYEMEPLVLRDAIYPWEKLEPETRAKCARYAAGIVEAWRKIGAV